VSLRFSENTLNFRLVAMSKRELEQSSGTFGSVRPNTSEGTRREGGVEHFRRFPKGGGEGREEEGVRVRPNISEGTRRLFQFSLRHNYSDS